MTDDWKATMKHGSPMDRGSADSYYGRLPKPHYYIGGSVVGTKVEEQEMTIDQIAEYWFGYYNETDRKEY